MASNPSNVSRVRWGRAVVAAILGEVVLILVAIPIFSSMPQDDATALLNVIVPPASFVAFVIAGWWAARPMTGGGAIQGGLAGLLAVVFYIALGVVASLFVAGTSVTDGFTPAYLLSHALKVIGGGVGGWWATRKAAG